MIEGKVNEFREAAIRLAVSGPGNVRQEVEAVLDTGFNGFLTLSKSVIQALGLASAGSRRATLADNSVVALNVYFATVEWLEADREVLVLEAEGGALVGMSLLYGSRVLMNVVEGGDVVIQAVRD